MPLKHAILGLLNYAEMTGYDIDRYFKSSIAFFWHAQTSQIYKELNTCTKHNWVDSEIVYQSDKPNKKVFHITEEGRLELHRWLADADLEDIMKYKNPLLIKIFFSSNIDIDQTMRLLEKYIRECSDIIDKMNDGTASGRSETKNWSCCKKRANAEDRTILTVDNLWYGQMSTQT